MFFKKLLIFFIVVFVVLFILNQRYHIIAFNLQTSSDTPTIRLMSYNAYGAFGDYKNKVFVDSLLVTIDSIHPEVLVLQEMHFGHSPMLCEELQKRYSYNALQELNERKSGNNSIAFLFSQYPIKSIFQLKDEQQADSVYDKYEVPDEVRDWGKQEIFNVVLDIKGKEILLVCGYLKTNNIPRIQKKGFKGFKEVLQKSLEGYWVGREIRYMDAQLIRDSIEHYNLPTIVCGDMNDFESSKTVQTIKGDDLKDVWWERGNGYGMTYNRHHLKVRIDHILTSKEFKTVDVSIPRLPFSDHYPLVADLKFAD